MAPIHKLPPEVATTIAAGEVIERPSSALKELIENSLDAGATRISIDLVDGGKTRIGIEDNGTGIPSAELPLAVESFSTSKIERVDDISRVNTLGFRGEALASIRSVSALTIRSRAGREDLGRELSYRGTEVMKDDPCVRNQGTEVIVENLFFNVPARKKFLRSAQSELRRIIGVIQGYALSFPETAFILKENGREILSYPSSSLRERAEIVLGAELFASLIPVSSASGRTRIHGFVSRGDQTRANRYMQFYFINRRYIRDRVLSHAVNQAYESLIPRDRFPAIVIFLDLPPEDIDVNVHPTKAEVRFRGEGEIHRLVLSSITASLKGNPPSFEESVESAYRGIFPSSDGETSADTAAYGLHGHLEGSAQDIGEGDRTFEFHETPLSLFGEEDARKLFTPGNLYWQLHQSFILIQIRGGMVIIDQHAAHERILFDRAKSSLVGGKPVVQSLLFPATMELPMEAYERYETLAPTLAALGFEIEPFGLRSIVVRGIPAGVRNWDDGRLIEEMLGEEGRSGIDEFLKTYACHSAIKAGMRLNGEEMESIADQLFATALPYTCPHGRPTMLRVSLNELERRFARTASTKR
ncbi:MAG: DNA mismatch repair endonuclease MutL [Candidatus Krumholzibacteria bacterium]|nr:DNA mismatch repair endonuclease MutL [Candidatus Krumholzibacteria bacterium]